MSTASIAPQLAPPSRRSMFLALSRLVLARSLPEPSGLDLYRPHLALLRFDSSGAVKRWAASLDLGAPVLVEGALWVEGHYDGWSVLLREVQP